MLACSTLSIEEFAVQRQPTMKSDFWILQRDHLINTVQLLLLDFENTKNARSIQISAGFRVPHPELYSLDHSQWDGNRK